MTFLSHFPVTPFRQGLVCGHRGQHSGWDTMDTNKYLEKEVKRREGNKEEREGGRRKGWSRRQRKGGREEVLGKWKHFCGRGQTGPSLGGWAPYISLQLALLRSASASWFILFHPSAALPPSLFCFLSPWFLQRLKGPHPIRATSHSIPSEYLRGSSDPWHSPPSLSRTRASSQSQFSIRPAPGGI